MDPFVSREWSAPATGSADIGWDRRPKPLYTRHHRPQRRQRLTPASLADQAARVAAAHIEDINASHLLGLSPRALQVLLRHLDLDSISLSTWKTWREIAQAGHLDAKNELALHQFLRHIEEPTADLSVYLAPLQSHNFAFISHLRIAGSCLIKSEELLYLPRWANNLGLLELIEPSDAGAPFPQLSDRLFKAWSLHDIPFPRLKGVRLASHSSVTKQSLQYLAQFPALLMLDVTSERRTWAGSKSLANAHGWIYCNWAEAGPWVDGEDNDDQGDIGPEVSLTSHKDWMRLSLEIDLLCVEPPNGIAREDVQSIPTHGFKIYNWLELPASKILQEAHIVRDPPWSGGALASLSLGRDRHLIRQRPYSSKRIFFWRYWQDGVKYPLPSKAKGQEASQKPPAAAEPRGKAGAAVLRTSKKRSAASISDVLSRFGGP